MDPTNPWKNNPWSKKGDSNKSSKTNQENPASTITSSHLLASNYVPSNLRAINTAGVSAYLPTKPLPNMKDDIGRIFYSILGSKDPKMSIGSSTNNGTGNIQYGHPAAAAKMAQYNKYQRDHDVLNKRPNPIKTVNEASFVLEQTQKRFRESVSVSSTTATTAKSDNEAAAAAAAVAKKIPSIGRDLIPGGRDTPGTTQHYLAVFRELLQVEHAETQRLFQVYDNYNVRIQLALEKPLVKGERGVNKGVAELFLLGISDGRPSVNPGDTVLIRPHNAVFLSPQHNSHNNPGNMMQTSVNNPYVTYPQQPMGFPNQQPNHGYHVSHQPLMAQMVEIVSHVRAVNRGKAKKDGKQAPDQILISWVEDSFVDHHLRIRNAFTVRFVPASSTHERSLTALHWLQSIHPSVARDLLFPSKMPKIPTPPAILESDEDVDTTEEREYEQLNTNQARFVEMVTARSAYPTKEHVRPPMVLTGPAGTGKTKTILAAILQILGRDNRIRRHHCSQQEKPTSNGLDHPRPRILICTPSHTACDVITERLANLLADQQRPQKESNDGDATERTNQIRKSIFRLYDATRPVESVPVQILSYTRQGGDGGQFVMPDIQELFNFSVIICTCQDAHLLYLAGLTNASLRKRRNWLKLDIERRLESAGLELRGTIDGCNAPHFTHLFIDEAAQATEPECLIPLSVVVDDHPDTIKVEIALCGDPRQLGPRVYSPTALEGLQRSLLERLLRLPVDTYGGGRDHLMGPPTADSRLTLDEMIEYSFQKTDHHKNLSVFLNLSYRGHPSFLYMPSKLFYFDKLKSINKSVSDEIWIQAVREIESLSTIAYPESLASKQMDWPIVFRGVNGKCTSMAVETFFGSNCWCNHAEADAIVEIIEKVVKIGVSTASIGVMAAFRAQVVLIRKLLRARNLGSVNVGMVEDYQSMERHIIILSLTRANKSLMPADVTSGEGLFRQPKRMNVALTRAEHALVVVGEPNMMREDPAWCQWLGFCKDNGLWYGAGWNET